LLTSHNISVDWPTICVCSINGLKEGYWSFTVEGALYSPVPSLMALSGGDTFGNVNVDYLLLGSDGVLNPFNMAGQMGTKFMGWVLPEWNNTRVLLQSQPTQLTDFVGPDGGIQVRHILRSLNKHHPGAVLHCCSWFCKLGGVVQGVVDPLCYARWQPGLQVIFVSVLPFSDIPIFFKHCS
jgi:hypothetical protein